MVVLLFVFAVLAAFGAGYAAAVLRTRAPRPETPPDHDDTPDEPGAEPTRVVFTRLAAEGTQERRLAMEDVSGRMRSAGVRIVVFVHGSFVGDDPLALARAVEEAVPALPGVARAFRSFTRAHVSRFFGEISSFSREYIDAVAAPSRSTSPCCGVVRPCPVPNGDGLQLALRGVV